MSGTDRMKIFVSYSHKDGKDLDEVVTGLRSQIPGTVTYDSHSIRSSRRIEETLRTMIGECDLCVVIRTDNSIKSTWCAAQGAVIPSVTPFAALIRAEHTNLPLQGERRAAAVVRDRSRVHRPGLQTQELWQR